MPGFFLPGETQPSVRFTAWAFALWLVEPPLLNTPATAQDMKSAFWLSKDPIGQDIICPRDGQAGCALVDWMPVDERREQTHYLSWTWQYSLQQVEVGQRMGRVWSSVI